MTATAGVPLTKWEFYKQEFQKFWIAGTVGAFFSAFARNLPLDFLPSRHPELNYTLQQLLRYGYLGWLLLYFFVSSTENLWRNRTKALDKWDIPFGMLQSLGALATAFCLGFVVQNVSRPYGFVVANGTILGICLLSLVWFHKVGPNLVNILRAVGGCLAAISMVVAYQGGHDTGALIALAVLLACLFGVLGAFGVYRVLNNS